MLLEIEGEVPSKKNMWRPAPGGRGLFLDPVAAAQIKTLIDRLWIEYRKPFRGPGPLLEHPALSFTFHVNNARSDRDNKLGTMLDVMQKAMVLRNDNVAWCNGRIVIEPAVLTSGEEKTVIEILPEEAAFEFK